VSRPNLEVAEIFRRRGDAWRADNAGHVSAGQHCVMTAIEACRTAALGGHVERCEDCLAGMGGKEEDAPIADFLRPQVG
jgi:hypothetical protein